MQTVNQFIQNGARSRRGAPFSARTISRPSLLVLNHVLALMLLIAIGNGPLMAQSNTGICANQSSIQYPLWGDGIKWNLPGLYDSIQLADIDGDGQDEMVGYGPFGVEVWHWDPNGLTWLQMNAAPPALGSGDFLLTADVDGDGQAEIIQVSPPGAVDALVVMTWHYDRAPQVWRLVPQLQMNLDFSYQIAYKGNTKGYPIQFADLNGSGRKQLVYLQYNNQLELVLQIYQVKPDGSGWAEIGSAPPAPTFNGRQPRGPFRIGRVDGDGLLDVVLLNRDQFYVFLQQPAAQGQISFAQPISAPLQNLGGFNDTSVPNFVLAQLVPNTQEFLVTIPTTSDTNLVGGGIQAYTFGNASHTFKQIYHPVDFGNTISTDPSQYLTMQVVHGGLFIGDNKIDTVLVDRLDGLDEYYKPYSDTANNDPLALASQTPFISHGRFGDDPSHYQTIQTGTVNYLQDGVLKSGPILVARDAGGMHTLIRSSNVCETGIGGFTIAQTKYFPPFLGGQAAAYSFISNKLVQNNFNIRSLYPNSYASLPSYEARLQGLTYPSTQRNLTFSQTDFDTVKSQLDAEFLAAGNVVAYFDTSKTAIDNLFTQEVSATQTILSSLGLPSDDTVDTQTAIGIFFANLALQAVGTSAYGLGVSSDASAHIGIGPEDANAAAIAISLIGTIISDAQTVAGLFSPGGGLGSSTVVVQNQIQDWHTQAATQNAIAQTVALQNWDIMRSLSQQVGDGTLSLSSEAEDQGLNAALNQFQIGTWQTLAPAVWTLAIVANYPSNKHYVVQGDTNIWVFPVLSSTATIFGSYSEPAQATMQQLFSLGVDLNDIVGKRNGWQNLNVDNPDLISCADNRYNCFTCPDHTLDCALDIPPDTPPTPLPQVYGSPATLSVLSGGEETAQTYSCGSATAPILKQSTPVYSVFPQPVTLQVQDANGNGVPNATIQVSGSGLLTPSLTVTTDSGGFSSVDLTANGIVQNDYLVTFQVTKPARDQAFSPCSVIAQYDLENAPGYSGGLGTIPTTPSIQSKSGPASARVWTIDVQDNTGTISSISLARPVLFQTRGSACSPSITSAIPVVMTGPDATGNFTGSITTDFSSCKGLTSFNLQIVQSATITLTDGNSYPAAGAAILSNIIP